MTTDSTNQRSAVASEQPPIPTRLQLVLANIWGWMVEHPTSTTFLAFALSLIIYFFYSLVFGIADRVN